MKKRGNLPLPVPQTEALALPNQSNEQRRTHAYYIFTLSHDMTLHKQVRNRDKGGIYNIPRHLQLQ